MNDERELAQMIADHSDGLTADDILRLAEYTRGDSTTSLIEALNRLALQQIEAS